MTLTLTTAQELAVDRAVAVASGSKRKLLTIGGYAGSGKSTILSCILEQAPDAIPCAYTGKAASVMRSKGVDYAGTIHSKIYVCDPKTSTFHPKTREEVRAQGSYFLVDEASMVGAAIFRDLMAYGLPVIAVGDHGQLPPVSKDAQNLMESPDVVLEEIHRQAEDNPIVAFSKWVREAPDLDGAWPDFDPSGDHLAVLERGQQSTGVSEAAVLRQRCPR